MILKHELFLRTELVENFDKMNVVKLCKVFPKRKNLKFGEKSKKKKKMKDKGKSPNVLRGKAMGLWDAARTRGEGTDSVKESVL